MIPQYPKIMPMPMAQNGNKNDIPLTTETAGLFTYNEGFPPITQVSVKAGGKAPQRNDFNGAFYALSQHLFFLQAGGQYQWNAELDYNTGAVIQGSDENQYLALQVSGPSSIGAKDPTVEENAAYWKKINFDLVQSIRESEDASTDKAPSEKAVANALKDKGNGLPLGHYFLHPHETIPEYAIAVNGGTYSRTLYKDLWDYAQKNGWVKTEAEWQELAGQNKGCCPYWSDGDGETTFRVSKFAPYQKLALTAGTYFEAGLPNITGSPGTTTGGSTGTGAFYKTAGNYTVNTNSTPAFNGIINFDASRSSAIYGNSDTVQPESHTWILCIVALNEATNIGEADVADVMAAIAKVQNDHNTLADKLTDTYISGLGMPSDEYIDWTSTFTTLDTYKEYIAPANGYVRISMVGGPTPEDSINLLTLNERGDVILAFQERNTNSAGHVAVMSLPVKKGHTIRIQREGSGIVKGVFFIYAQGEI